MNTHKSHNPVKKALNLSLLISLSLLGVVQLSHANTQHQQPIDWSAPHIPETPKTTLAEFARTHDLVLFTASHCHFCKQFEPVVQQLAAEYGFTVQVFYFGHEKPTAFPTAETVSEALIANFYANQPLSTPLLALYSKADHKAKKFDYVTVQRGAAKFEAVVNTLEQIINQNQ